MHNSNKLLNKPLYFEVLKIKYGILMSPKLNGKKNNKNFKKAYKKNLTKGSKLLVG